MIVDFLNVRRVRSPARFAREKVYALYIEVFGQFGFGRGAFVTVETLHDLTVCQTNAGNDFVKLCLRQSAANSGRPEIDVASCGKRKLPLNDDIGEIQASSRTQYPTDLAKCAVFIGR